MLSMVEGLEVALCSLMQANQGGVHPCCGPLTSIPCAARDANARSHDGEGLHPALLCVRPGHLKGQRWESACDGSWGW